MSAMLRIGALISFLAVTLLLGCQRYVTKNIEIRNAANHLPVQADVEVGYDLHEEFSRAFTLFSPKLKRSRTQTDENGRGVIKVAPDVACFVLAKSNGTVEFFGFHGDGSLSHSFGQIHEQHGWLSTRLFGMSEQAGVLEVRITESGAHRN